MTYGIAASHKDALCLGMGLLDEAFLSLYRFCGSLYRKDLFMRLLSLILILPIDYGRLVVCLNELIDGP